MINTYFRQARDTVVNTYPSPWSHLTYIVEPANWVVAESGNQLTRALNTKPFINARCAITSRGLRHSIVHFGALPTFLTAAGWRHFHPSNQAIVTAFHLANPAQANLLSKAAPSLKFIHTTNSITRHKLQQADIPPHQIKQIPLGVNTGLFRPVNSDSQKAIRAQLKLPTDKFIIGSFQKDGVGWGDGLEPKLIKGPDIFVKTIATIAKHHPVHVLLAGPARGYVERSLTQNKIPVTNLGFQKDFTDIAPLYHALDAYLITSRVEGGPKQILEAWASGIPVVTTPVGMIPDIARHNHTALISPSDLPQNLLTLLKSPDLAHRLTQNSQQEVIKYDWNKIAQRYFAELYQPLLINLPYAA